MGLSHTGAAIAPYVAIFVAAYVLYRWSPSWALMALFASEPFAFETQIGATTISLPKVVLVALLVGIVIDIARRRSAMQPGWSRWIFLACAGLVAATALSLSQAANVGDATRETFKAIEYALVVFAAWSIASRTDTKGLAASAPLVMVAVCMTALSDFWSGPKSVLVLDGVTIPRIAGVLEGPNQLGGWIALLVPFVLAFALTAERAWQRYAQGLALFAGVFTAMLTYSRASLISIALELVCVFTLIRARSRVRVAGIILAAIVGAAALSAHYSPKAFVYHDDGARAVVTGGVATRPILWTAAIELWERHALLGLGAGNFEDSLPLVNVHNVKTHANNVYLQALVEGGLPLFFATIAMLLAPLAMLAGFVRRHEALAAAYAAACGFAAHGVVDDLWFFPKVGLLWCIAIGVAAARVDALQRQGRTHSIESAPDVGAARRRLSPVGQLQPALAERDGTNG